jgi:hypothetical protein
MPTAWTVACCRGAVYNAIGWSFGANPSFSGGLGMRNVRSVLSAVVLFVAALAGCMTLPGGAGGGGTVSDLVAAVAAKATDVADQVGGAEGFGGMMMGGYRQHGPAGMGFVDDDDLADSNGVMMVRMHNRTQEACTLHMSYIASYLGLDEETEDFDIPAGGEVTFELPCAEIVGAGPLTEPGGVGCHVGTNGLPVGNHMMVPGFLGLDYTCESDTPYECYLQPDEDDLDGDGDTTELILLSEAMQFHMQNGGPMGHHHGDGPGMMGSHMGGQMGMGGMGMGMRVGMGGPP